MAADGADASDAHTSGGDEGCHQGNASVAAQPVAPPSGLVVPPASECASVHSVTTVFGSVRPPIESSPAAGSSSMFGSIKPPLGSACGDSAPVHVARAGEVAAAPAAAAEAVCAAPSAAPGPPLFGTIRPPFGSTTAPDNASAAAPRLFGSVRPPLASSAPANPAIGSVHTRDQAHPANASMAMPAASASSLFASRAAAVHRSLSPAAGGQGACPASTETEYTQGSPHTGLRREHSPVGNEAGSGPKEDASNKPVAASSAGVSLFGSLRPPIGTAPVARDNGGEAAGKSNATSGAGVSLFGSLRPPIGTAPVARDDGGEAAGKRLDKSRPAQLRTSSASSTAEARPQPVKNQIAGLFSNTVPSLATEKAMLSSNPFASGSFTGGRRHGQPSKRAIESQQQGELGILTALQSALDDLKTAGAANAAGTIANLSLRPEVQDALSKVGALDALMRTLKRSQDDAVRRFICMSLSRVAARRDLAPMLVSGRDGMLVRLLLDASEESNSRGGLWRQALRVLALLAAFARDFFVSEPGEFYGSLAQPEASPRAHLGSSKSDDLAERPTGGDITGEPIIEETGRMTSGQAKISSEDRLRVLFGMKRLLKTDQTELQTDAMQALVPWTRSKEHVAVLSACGLWNAVMIAAKGPSDEAAASLSSLKARQPMSSRPGSSMHGVLQTMAINLVRCAAETAAAPWPPSLDISMAERVKRNVAGEREIAAGGSDNTPVHSWPLLSRMTKTEAEAGRSAEDGAGSYVAEEQSRKHKEVAALCGSLCLESEAVALLCALACQRPQFPVTPQATPTADVRATARPGVDVQARGVVGGCRSPHGQETGSSGSNAPPSPSTQASSSATSPSSSPSAQRLSPQAQQRPSPFSRRHDSRSPSPQGGAFSYAYLRAARNHMSTRAAQALCATVALAHSDVELEMQLQAGAGAEIQHQLWRMCEWEEAREEGGCNELGEFDGKQTLLVALANLRLRGLWATRA